LEKLSDIKVEHLIRTYDANLNSKFQYSSMQHIVIGGLILWLSWFFFNGSAGFSITEMATNPSKIPPKTIMNTLLSGSVAALVVFFFKPVIMRKVSPVSNFNPANIINGLLSGHVAITGACNNVESYSAIAIGLIAGFWYIFSCRLIVRIKVDDPVNASQIHLFCGIWGVLAIGFFDETHGLINTGDFS
jgi:ammonium transporter, Amt family